MSRNAIYRSVGLYGDTEIDDIFDMLLSNIPRSQKPILESIITELLSLRKKIKESRKSESVIYLPKRYPISELAKSLVEEQSYSLKRTQETFQSMVKENLSDMLDSVENLMRPFAEKIDYSRELILGEISYLKTRVNLVDRKRYHKEIEENTVLRKELEYWKMKYVEFSSPKKYSSESAIVISCSEIYKFVISPLIIIGIILFALGTFTLDGRVLGSILSFSGGMLAYESVFLLVRSFKKGR